MKQTSGLGHDISMKHVKVLVGTAHVVLQVLPLRVPGKVADIDTRARHAGSTSSNTTTIVTRPGLYHTK